MEFLIKSAYDGACLWAHVYCVHLMFLCIINKRPRPVSKNARRFLRGPRRIAMLNKNKNARAKICSSCGARKPQALFHSITTLARHGFCMYCSTAKGLPTNNSKRVPVSIVIVSYNCGKQKFCQNIIRVTPQTT